MNWSHLRAMLWMRWRILANRVKRGGKVGNTLFGVLLFLGASASFGFFILALLMGMELLPEAQPMHLMLVWGALALGFLFAWMIGLLTDLQRSDSMSFKSLLHLPVSLGWVFLYNYLSSFVSLSAAIFLPAMIGLCIAMVLVYGWPMLSSVPLVLGYFGVITALTYQLRGWLAHLMENKRRGRNVVAAITVFFVLLLQAPNLINLRFNGPGNSSRREEFKEQLELRRAASEEGPGQAEAIARLDEWLAAEAEKELDLDRNLSLGAMLVPLGWLPYGVRAASEGRWLPSGLCVLGLLGITTWSLRRSYRATLASVVGAGSVEVAEVPLAVTQAAPGAEASGARKPLLVERSLPFTDESVAGIATAGLRSLLRAPEAKMLLLSPVILLGLFGFMLSSNPALDSMAPFAPMMSLGAIAMGLLSISQLLQNSFGLDRGGFRVYVLSPTPRYKILLGKNLAVAPLAIGISLIALIGLQFFVPVDLSHFLGACLQLFSAYLLLCLVDNMISILGPMRLRENGLKAADVRFKTILLQLVVVLLIPITLAPLLIPAGLEFFLGGEPWAEAVPLYLTLHALGLGAIWLLYRWLIRRQGALLQEREQHILDILTRT